MPKPLSLLRRTHKNHPMLLACHQESDWQLTETVERPMFITAQAWRFGGPDVRLHPPVSIKEEEEEKEETTIPSTTQDRDSNDGDNQSILLTPSCFLKDSTEEPSSSWALLATTSSSLTMFSCYMKEHDSLGNAVRETRTTTATAKSPTSREDSRIIVDDSIRYPYEGHSSSFKVNHNSHEHSNQNGDKHERTRAEDALGRLLQSTRKVLKAARSQRSSYHLHHDSVLSEASSLIGSGIMC